MGRGRPVGGWARSPRVAEVRVGNLSLVEHGFPRSAPNQVFGLGRVGPRSSDLEEKHSTGTESMPGCFGSLTKAHRARVRPVHHESSVRVRAGRRPALGGPATMRGLYQYTYV